MYWPRITLERVNSTNSLALDLLKAGFTPPFVVIAYEQKEGKGRYGHRWFSPRGGVFLSLAIREGLKSWTLLAANAVIRATEFLLEDHLPSHLEIKLPNDVLLKGKKIAGILGEQSGDNTVIGIGWNVSIREFPGEIKERATSLTIETGRVFPVEVAQDLLILQLKEIERELRIAPGNLFKEWKKRIGDLGKRIRFEARGATMEGVLADITEDFKILLEGQGEIVDLLEIKNLERLE